MNSLSSLLEFNESNIFKNKLYLTARNYGILQKDNIQNSNCCQTEEWLLYAIKLYYYEF